MTEKGTHLLATFSAALVMVGLIIGSLYALERSLEEHVPEPQLGLLMDETWTASSVYPPDETMAMHHFHVDRGVDTLQLSYVIRLGSAGLDDILLNGRPYAFDPFVTLSLRAPDDQVEWQSWSDATVGDTVTLDSPTAGTWTLVVKARGYGTDVPESGLPFPFHDHVHVIVEAV